MVKKGFKAFRLDKDGNLRFLFHTHDGSSLVPFNTWITTKRIWVSNPGEKKRKYRAGFHFMPKIDDMEKFDNLTKGKYVIFPVKFKDIEPKPRTSVGSWLATSMYVDKVEFEKALKGKQHGKH